MQGQFHSVRNINNDGAGKLSKKLIEFVALLLFYRREKSVRQLTHKKRIPLCTKCQRWHQMHGGDRGENYDGAGKQSYE
jgi:hypothetical protein